MSKSFGTDVLFEPFSAQIAGGDRIALIGDNGVGKSTLLRVVADEEEPTDGAVRRIGGIRIGYLPQTARLDNKGSVWEAVELAFARLQLMEQELRTLEATMAEQSDDTTLHGYDELLHRFAADGGYEIEARTRAALAGVGFGEDDYDRPVAQLSGGENARAALARTLLEAPDVLLLDEPTNHLDFAALDWLEAELLRFSGGLLLVSHDRHLLERVSNRTWEIAFESVTTYRVGYGPSRELRAADRDRRLERFERQEETIERYKDFVRRNKAGQKVRQAKDREKKLERIEKDRIEAPREAKRIHLNIRMGQPSGKRVLSLRNLSIGFEKPLFICPDVDLPRGEKVAIIGPNGCGKTTLLRTITGEHRPLGGTIELGHNVHAATYSQNQEGLHGPDTVLREILSRSSLSIGEARGLLGSFLFSGEDVAKKMQSLSGGERSRIALALLSLIEGNLLLFDEPTNHLDLASQEILEQALIDYPGTILLISHDRALLEAVSTHVWVIEGDRMSRYAYGYAEYRRRLPIAEMPPLPPAQTPGKSPESRKTSNVDKKHRQQEQVRQQAESKIEYLEEQLERIESALAEASSSGDTDQVAALGTEHGHVKEALEKAYAAWHTLTADTT